MNRFNRWVKIKPGLFIMITDACFDGSSYLGFEYRMNPETQEVELTNDFYPDPKDSAKNYDYQDPDLSRYEKESMIYNLFETVVDVMI